MLRQCVLGAGLLTALVAGAGGAFAASGEANEADEVVDVELVLAVDVSLSMSPTELEIQRAGYAAALTHELVVRAIRDGVYGKIAVTYVEWAGDFSQRVVVPWMSVSGDAEAREFANLLTATPARSARRTSISGGLNFAASQFLDNGFRGLKRVIDISGDGPNNQGEPVIAARDRVVSEGITINGLPLLTNSGFTSTYDVPDLDLYYTHCVIGGPGAFMIPVNDWTQFPEAVRRKLVLELASAEPPAMRPEAGEALPVLRSQLSPSGYNCMIGEQMWMQRSRMWEAQ